MREPSGPAVGSDPLALEVLALHYAAGELPAARAAAFEARLATDQDARDALSEAVRLSAAALGQSPPAPDRSFRGLIRDRLWAAHGWRPRGLSRGAYRGHPLAWGGLGAGVAAAAALVGIGLAGPPGPPPVAVAAADPPVLTRLGGGGGPPLALPAGTPLAELAPVAYSGPVHAPAGSEAAGHDDVALREAEIWAELSTPDHIGKAHDDDLRWRQRLRGLHPGHPDRPGLAGDPHGP